MSATGTIFETLFLIRIMASDYSMVRTGKTFQNVYLKVYSHK